MSTRRAMEHEDQQPEKRAETVFSALSLGGLIAGFRTYIRTWQGVLRCRHRYAAEVLSPLGHKAIGSAIVVFLYGATLSFIIYFPAGRLVGSSFPKVHFVLSEAYEAAVFILLMQLVIVLFRGRGSFSQTAAIYLTGIGLIAPVAFAYPFQYSHTFR
jgi:hypothetical protein